MVLRDALQNTVHHGSAGLFTFSGKLPNNHLPAEFELLLLPLTHLGNTVERVLGTVSVLTAPTWLETTVPRALTLTSNETIWPDGRPRRWSTVDQPIFNTPASPSLKHDTDVRRARLVRREKRSFLVYQGGRSDMI